MMLSTQETLNTADFNNFVAIPFEHSGQFDNVQVLQNVVIETLPNGSVCLVDNGQYLDKNYTPEEQFKEEQLKLSPYLITPSCSKNVRTILLQPTKAQMEKTSAPKQIYPKNTEIMFKCIKCSQELDSLTAYRKHMLWHANIKKFQCTECSAGYNIENNLKIHMALHLKGKPKCPICNLSFQRLASLKSHLLLHQEEETFICEECSAEFEKEDELLKHLEQHATNATVISDSLTCSYCKLEFEDSAKFKEHISDHIKVKRIINKGKRNKKSRNSYKDARHVCSKCNKSFPKPCLLERHQRIHSGVKPFMCKICKKGFSQSGTLQIHMLKHNGIKPYACTLCPAKFSQKGNFKVHVEKTHTASSDSERRYKCNLCACIFRKVASLNGHMTKIHASQEAKDIDAVMDSLKELQKQTAVPDEPEKPLSDNEANEFDVKNLSDYVKVSESVQDGECRKYLVKHKKIGDTRYYFCNYCSKKFKKPSDLIRHTRIHTKEKPFKCPHCNSSFALKATLMTHVRTHFENKKFKCEICHCTYCSLKSLIGHLKIHKQIIPVTECKTCYKVFITSEEAEAHNTEFSDHDIQTLLIQPNPSTSYDLLQSVPSKILTPNIGLDNIEEKRLSTASLKSNRKYKCHLCSITCNSPKRLTEHINSHNNVRNFSCQLCPKKFTTLHLLNRHKLTHTMEKPFMCLYCDKKFKTFALCKAHTSKIHKKEVTLQTVENTPTTIVSQEQNMPVFDLTDMIDGNELIFQKPENQINIITSETPNEINIEKDQVQVPVTTNIDQSLYQISSDTILKESESDALISESNQTYETIYINSDLLPADNTNICNSLFSQIKLQNNDSLLLNSINDLQSGNILFNIDHLTNEDAQQTESNILNANQFFNTSDPAILSNISEISPKQIDDSLTDKASEKEKEEFSDNHLNALLPTNIQLFPNVSFDGLTQDKQNISVNIFNNSEVTLTDIPTLTEDNTEQSEITNFLCINEKCNRVFDNIGDFQKHFCHVGMEEVSAKSAQAEKSTPVKGKQKRSKPNFECIDCHKVFSSRNNYVKHLATHSNGEGKSLKVCEYCSKAFKKPSDLKRHLRTHTGERPFPCDKCDKKFSLKSTLESHKRSHELQMSKDFNCVVCNSFFTSKSTLKLHMLIHTGKRPHSCSFCPLKFRTLSSKKSHENIKHLQTKSETKKPQKVVNLLASIANDVRITEDETENLQSKDDYQVDISNDLSSHISIDADLLQQLQSTGFLIQDNTTLLPSVIKIDDKITLLNINNVSLNNLEVNNVPSVETETEIPIPPKKPRTLECDICHKMYASKDVLRKHKKIHGRNKKFLCNKCNKGFDTQEEIDKHDKFHMGYRPVSCKYCANSFTDNKGLKAHMKRIHQNIEKLETGDIIFEFLK